MNAPAIAVERPTLKLIEKALFSYPETVLVSNRWGQGGGRSLRFSDQAMLRLGSLLGWIHGLAFRDADGAEVVAARFFERMDWLARYGGYVDEKWRVPTFLVKLSDYGDFGCFYVNWYAGVPFETAKDMPEPQGGWDKTDRTYSPIYWYGPRMNGALIMSGFDRDYEKFNPDHVQWSTHT